MLKVVQLDQRMVSVKIIEPEPQEVVRNLILDILGGGLGHDWTHTLNECIILNQSYIIVAYILDVISLISYIPTIAGIVSRKVVF